MLVFLASFCLSADYCGTVAEFDLHGSVKTIEAVDGWVYFGMGFGDFGHSVHVEVWPTGQQDEVSTFYYTTDHKCPSTSSTSTSSSVFLEGGGSQYAIFGFPQNGTWVVSVNSAVRPIHPNSPMTTLYSFFIFFGVNLALTGGLQFFYYRTAMDPTEYQLIGSQ